MPIARCPICIDDGQYVTPEYRFNVEHWVCNRSGEYLMSASLTGNLVNQSDYDELWPYLAAFTRQQTVDLSERVVLNFENWAEFARQHRDRDVPQKLLRLLEPIGRRSPGAGDVVELQPHYDFPEVDGRAPSEMMWLTNALATQGLIHLEGGGSRASLTAEGWERYRPKMGTTARTCFVAMAFAEDMEPVYAKAIKPAIDACGFRVLRVDRVEHNGNINDKILAAIRASQFMVADFTHHRSGVYFEAGFALGLGREVIWSCHESAFGKLHFDTRPYNHIKWSEHGQLMERLVNRIRATIPGARLTDVS